MELVLRERQGVHCLQIKGSINVNDVKGFERFIRDIEKKKLKRVLVDFRESDNICSAALGILMEYYESLEEEGGKLIVRQPGPAVMAVFERLGLDVVLPMVKDEEEAREYF